MHTHKVWNLVRTQISQPGGNTFDTRDPEAASRAVDERTAMLSDESRLNEASGRVAFVLLCPPTAFHCHLTCILWLAVSLYHFFIISLYHCIAFFIISLYHGITVSLDHWITVSLFYHITVSLYHCITVSLFHFFYHIIVSLCHCITVSLYHCFTFLSYYCITFLLYHCITASLYHCMTRCITIIWFCNLQRVVHHRLYRTSSCRGHSKTSFYHFVLSMLHFSERTYLLLNMSASKCVSRAFYGNFALRVTLLSFAERLQTPCRCSIFWTYTHAHMLQLKVVNWNYRMPCRWSILLDAHTHTCSLCSMYWGVDLSPAWLCFTHTIFMYHICKSNNLLDNFCCRMTWTLLVLHWVIYGQVLWDFVVQTSPALWAES